MRLVGLLLPLGLATAVLAYDPPIDGRAGPLTARIHDPSAASQIGMPVRISLSLENRGCGELKGTVRVQAVVSSAFSRDVVRKYWLLNRLTRAPALRRIEGLEFTGDNLHRKKANSDNGAEVRVNRGSDPREIPGHVLPECGFFARVPAGETAIECRGGATVEWARDGAEMVFTPLPSSERFSVQLDWKALGWLRGEPHEAEAIDEDGNVLSGTAMRANAGWECLLACEPGVFAYRLKGPGEMRAASAAR